MFKNQTRSNAPKMIKRFIEHYWRMKEKVIKLKVKIVENAPLQGNGYDCGVFLCQNAEKLARKVFVSTRQDDMPYARKKMMKEIFLGALEAGGRSNKHVKEVKKMQVQNKETTKQKVKQASNRKQIHNNKEVPKQKAKQVPSEKQPNREDTRKPKLKWPKANSKEWGKLDEDLTALLRIVYSPPEKLAESHPRIIYEMSKERFGIIEHGDTRKKRPSGPSKRQRKCRKLREEINQLKQTYKDAPEHEKEGIDELQKEKLKKLRLAKRAESIRQSRKKFSANCKEFLGQPYQFSRNLLAPKPRGELQSTKEEVEKHLHKAHSNPDQHQEREDHEDLISYEQKDVEFDDDPPAYKEFAKKLRKTSRHQDQTVYPT